MFTPAEAAAAIAASLEGVEPEQIDLGSCAGRILRAPVFAERDAPPFDRVAMDGIAIDGRDRDRRAFRIAGVQAAGVPAQRLDSPGDCFEAMTGAPLPVGCDTVIPVEQLELSGGRATVRGEYQWTPSQHVHRRGADARRGDALIAAGTRLGAPELAVAASAGLARLAVSRALRIAVISTGDELVEPGQPILDHQVRRSNTYGLAAALTLAGYPPVTDLHLPDRAAVIESALADALRQHDVLVLSGGVSAGRFDHLPAVLATLGVRRVFHGVAQRPGRPMWFGVRPPGAAVFALPGNPVSVLVCLARYVVPALRQLSGAAPAPPPTAVLAREFACDAPLAFFLPVALGYDRKGRAMAEPRPTGGSGDFIALVGTDGFVELPAGPATHRAGLAVPFYRW
ncbi:MAG: molybdopterin molybdotransferase MoeA [Steroidobacteraceae bacterium]